MNSTFSDLYQAISSKTRLPFSHLRINLFPILAACFIGGFIGISLLVSPWLALTIAFGIIIIAASFVKPILLCYLLIAGISLTSGMQRGKLIPFLIPNEVILMLCAYISVLIVLARKYVHNVNLEPIIIGIIALVIGTMVIPGISYLLRGTTLLFKDYLVLLSSIQFILLFFIFTYLPRNNTDRRRIIEFMLLCGMIVAVVGLLQGAKIGFITTLLDNWYSSAHEIKAASYGRITSLMSAWNVLGMFMMINLFITWAFAISKPTYLNNVLIIAALVLCTGCIVASGSYAGLIGLLLGIVLITILLRGINIKATFLFFVLIIIVLGVVILFKPLIQERLNSQFGYGGLLPHTLVYRFDVWRGIFLPALKQNLLWENQSYYSYYLFLAVHRKPIYHSLIQFWFGWFHSVFRLGFDHIDMVITEISLSSWYVESAYSFCYC